MKTLDKYVIFSIGVTLIYTITEFIVSTMTGISHETLSTCVYSFFAGEVVVAGLIKIFKIRQEDLPEQEPELPVVEEQFDEGGVG